MRTHSSGPTSNQHQRTQQTSEHAHDAFQTSYTSHRGGGERTQAAQSDNQTTNSSHLATGPGSNQHHHQRGYASNGPDGGDRGGGGDGGGGGGGHGGGDDDDGDRNNRDDRRSEDRRSRQRPGRDSRPEGHDYMHDLAHHMADLAVHVKSNNKPKIAQTDRWCIPKLQPQSAKDTAYYTFHLWHKALTDLAALPGTNEDLLLNKLKTDLTILSPAQREEIQHEPRFKDAMDRLVLLAPPIDLTLPVLESSLLWRAPGADTTEGIIERCGDLLRTLEVIRTLHPEHDLDKQKATAILGQLASPMSMHQLPLTLDLFQANKTRYGIRWIASVTTHIQNARRTRVEIAAAQRTYAPREADTTLFLLGKAVDPDLQFPSQHQQHWQGGDSKTTAGMCHLCRKSHIERYYFCPTLPSLVSDGKKLPASVCTKCLKKRNLCEKDCHLLRSKNKTRPRSLLCSTHKEVHYRICPKCPSKDKQTTFPIKTPHMRMKVAGIPIANRHQWSQANKLPNVVALEQNQFLTELIDIRTPTGGWTPALLFYDGGGGLSLISEGHSKLDQFPTPKQSVPVRLESIHGARTKSFPIFDIHIKVTTSDDHKALSIQCSESNFPLTETNSLLADRDISFRGERVTVIPTDRDFSNDPSICLGVKYMNHFPERISPTEYTDRFKREFPHASLYRSQITGNLLIGGNLDSLDQTISMLGKATSGEEFFTEESDNSRYQPPQTLPEEDNYLTTPEKATFSKQEPQPRKPAPVHHKNGSSREDTIDEKIITNHKGLFILNSEDTAFAKFEGAKIMYDLLMEELSQSTTPNTKSLDLDGGRIGCRKCDKRITTLTDECIENNRLIGRQLIWTPTTPSAEGSPRGHFVIHRLHRAAIKCFPDCEQTVTTSTSLLIAALESRPNTARLCSYKLETDMLNGHCRFLEEGELMDFRNSNPQFDKGAPFVFLPQLVVYNVKSESTAARLVIVPNRPVKTNFKGKAITFNDTLHDYALHLPVIEHLHVAQTIAVNLVGCDVKDAFRCLGNDLLTGLRCLTMALRKNDGSPTFLRAEATKGSKPVPVLWSRASYGQKDLPQLYTAALHKTVSVYREQCPNTHPEWALQQLEFCLVKFAYCDDLELLAFPAQITSFLEKRGDDFVTSQKPTPSEYKNHDSWLRKQSCLYLEYMSTVLCDVLTVSGFRLKSLDCRNKALKQQINKHHCIISNAPMKKPNWDPPPAALVHNEANKKKKTLRPLPFSSLQPPEKTKGEIYLQMLGRDFISDKDQMSLKTQYLTLTDKRGKPQQFIYSLKDFKAATSHPFLLTKKHLFSLLGQFYCPSGLMLAGAKMVLKLACARLQLASPGHDWDQPVGEEVSKTIMSGVAYYFATVNLKLPRSQIIHHPATSYWLLGQSDAGGHLHGHCTHLVSHLDTTDGLRAEVQKLALQVYVNRQDIISIPFLELLSFTKCLSRTVALYSWLRSMGLHIPATNVILMVDSSTAMLHLRSRPAIHSKRVGNLIAKCQLLLLEVGWSPFDNVFFFDQTKANFQADKLTKDLTNHTEAGITNHHTKLMDDEWMKTPRASWNHLSRHKFVPKHDTPSLASDLEVSPDYKFAVAELLKRSTADPTSQVLTKPSTIHLGMTTSNPEISEDNQTLNSTTSQRIAHLLERKSARGLEGPRSAIRILAVFRYYTLRLRWLARHGTPSIRARLKKDLEQRKRQGPRYCNIVSCHANTQFSDGKMSRGSRCPDPNHPTTNFPSLCDIRISWADEEVKCSLHSVVTAPECAFDRTPDHTHTIGDNNEILEHWSQIPTTKPTDQQQTPLDIARQIATQEAALVTIPWTDYHIDIFEAAVLQILCCHYPGDDSIPEVEVFQGQVTDTHTTTYALGRRQRDRSNYLAPIDVGRPLLRIIDPDSPLGRLAIISAHKQGGYHSQHGGVPERERAYLIRKGIYFKNMPRILHLARKHCQSCKRMRAFIGKKKDYLFQSEVGPSETLCSLAFSKHVQGEACVDLAGPFLVKCHAGQCTQKTWALLILQQIGRLSILPMQDYSAKSVLMTLTQYSHNHGAFLFLSSDLGSQFQPFGTQLSQTREEDPDSLTRAWSCLLSDSDVRTLRENTGSTFRLHARGRSRVQGSVERQVHNLKIFLTKTGLFKRDAPIDFYEFTLALSKVCFINNTKPILAYQNSIYSIDQLLTATLTNSPAADNPTLSEAGCTHCPSSLSKFKAKLATLQQITADILKDALDHHIPLLLGTNVRNRLHRPVCSTIRKGDILFDSVTFKQSGNVTGSLARAVAIGEGGRWVILSKLRPAYLFSGRHDIDQKGRKKQTRTILISRSADLLLPVVQHQEVSTEATIFPNNTNLFDINSTYKALENQDWQPLQFPTEDPNLVQHLETMHPSGWEAYLNSTNPQPTSVRRSSVPTESMELEEIALDQPTAEAVRRDQWLTEELDKATSDTPEDSYKLKTRTTRSNRISKPPARYSDH